MAPEKVQGGSTSRGRAAARKIALMYDERSVITMAVDVSASPIRGSLDDGAGTVTEFAGWLELMSAVERACDRLAEREREEEVR